MTRFADSLLQSGDGVAVGALAPMLNVKYGGQMGYSPDYAAIVNNASYVRKNLICILVQAPRGFAYLPNPQQWVEFLRALVETHAQSIEGLAAGLTADFFDNNPVGGAGEMQEDVTDVKRARSEVSFRWGEKYGAPIVEYFTQWIQYLMMDPNTKVATVATLPNGGPPDLLPDVSGATMLFIEPDPMNKFVMRAWLGTNMMPKISGEIRGKRELTAAGDTEVYDIGFTGVYQYGLGVKLFAQQVLDSIDKTGANPYNRTAFINAIDEDVLATNTGYAQGVNDLVANTIPT